MLIFSDVDGTLLGEDGTCPLPGPTLRDAAQQHEVVLASSREISELAPIASQFGFSSWCVAEDGAVIGRPEGVVDILGVPRARLVAAMRSSLSTREHAALLGSEPIAARQRLASVLLPISVITPKLRDRLEMARLNVTVGGRWGTITSESNKGVAAGVVSTHLDVPCWAAIGNAANDATLLGEAWRAFVIRNPDGHDPALAVIPDAVLLAAPGPAGWLEMLRLLDQPTGDSPGKERHDDDSAVDDHHPDDPGT